MLPPCPPRPDPELPPGPATPWHAISRSHPHQRDSARRPDARRRDSHPPAGSRALPAQPAGDPLPARDRPHAPTSTPSCSPPAPTPRWNSSTSSRPCWASTSNVPHRQRSSSLNPTTPTTTHQPPHPLPSCAASRRPSGHTIPPVPGEPTLPSMRVAAGVHAADTRGPWATILWCQAALPN